MLEVHGKVWKYNGKAAWYFLTISKAVSESIRSQRKARVGWGSVRVRVDLGSSTWETSVFPSKDEGGYVLPIKASIRKKEGIDDGTKVTAELTLI